MLQREREMQSVVTTTTTASPFRLGKNVPTVTSSLVERGLLLLPILSSCWGPCSHEHLTAYKAFMPTLALNWRHNTSWTRGNLSSTLLLLTPAETSDWDRENKRKFWGGEAKKAHYSLSISLAPWLSRRHGIWLKHSGLNLYQQIQRDALLTSENLTQLRYPLKQSQWQEPFFFIIKPENTAFVGDLLRYVCAVGGLQKKWVVGHSPLLLQRILEHFDPSDKVFLQVLLAFPFPLQEGDLGLKTQK